MCVLNDLLALYNRWLWRASEAESEPLVEVEVEPECDKRDVKSKMLGVALAPEEMEELDSDGSCWKRRKLSCCRCCSAGVDLFRGAWPVLILCGDREYTPSFVRQYLSICALLGALPSNMWPVCSSCLTNLVCFSHLRSLILSIDILEDEGPSFWPTFLIQAGCSCMLTGPGR